jgi:hypothetical protein
VVNSSAKQLIEIINSSIRFESAELIKTRYGGKIIWNLPKSNKLIVHLKNKNLIRKGKRWSQVNLK